ncbi:chromo domain containing protein [Gracilaria domingensis]|nr:chromo domain containing protein [Gracilaria domingensis]
MVVGERARGPRAVELCVTPSSEEQPVEVSEDKGGTDLDSILPVMKLSDHESDASNGPTDSATNAGYQVVDAKESDEYPVESIVGNERTPEGLQYRVRWYGWGPEGDTSEPPSAIPRNFAISYWRSQREPMPPDC